MALTFDSDLDPATLARAIIMTGPDGHRIPASLRYDPTAKVVIAQGSFAATTHVEVTSAIKDIKGRGATNFDAVLG